MTAPRRPLRAVVLIALAALALGLGVGHALLPSPAPGGDKVRRAAATPALARRPAGTLHLAGRGIPSPDLVPDEYAVVSWLAANGFTIQRIDPSPWDGLFDQAVADVVTTDHGQLVMVAPQLPGHTAWVCPGPRDGAIIGGGDAPSYEIGVGGDRATVQLGGPAYFGRTGDVILVSQNPGVWQRVAGLVTAAACPSGQ